MNNCKTCKHKEHLTLNKDFDTGASHECGILSATASVEFGDMLEGGYTITDYSDDDFFKVSFVLDGCPLYEAE